MIASGILKQTSWKRQTGLGVPATGTLGKTARRTSSVFKADRDTFESNEIVSHHQSTGVTYGLQKADGKIDGLISSGTYADFMASILERDFTVVTPGAAAAATTVAFVSGFTYTITRGAGSFITDGLKEGNIIRITGAGINAANINKNLLIITVVPLVCTVLVLNSSAMVAEGPIATYVLTVVGKKTFAPISAHTKDYYTIEEWYSDLSRSETFIDMRVSSMAISLPATGNATISTDFVGLSRVLGAAQILTAPATTVTSIMGAANGDIVVNGVPQTNITTVSINIANSAANAGAVIGSNVGFDVTTGRIKVSGSFTALFDSATIQLLYNAETNIDLNMILAGDETATSDFLCIMIPRLKMTGDAPDDGEKAIARTYPFTAEYNATGGATTAYEQSIMSFQDSAA